MNSGATAGKTNELEDFLDLDESLKTPQSAGNSQNKPQAAESGNNKQATVDNKPNAKKEVKVDSKKTKITIELDNQTLDEIKVLTTLNVYESKEEFIVAAIGEKIDEVMLKIKNVIKKK